MRYFNANSSNDCTNNTENNYLLGASPGAEFLFLFCFVITYSRCCSASFFDTSWKQCSRGVDCFLHLFFLSGICSDHLQEEKSLSWRAVCHTFFLTKKHYFLISINSHLENLSSTLTYLLVYINTADCFKDFSLISCTLICKNWRLL